MNKTRNWLKEQRVSGGYNTASSMFLKSADANRYVEFFVNRINRDSGIELRVTISHSGIEINLNNEIVWFGREVDVDLLRTVKFDLFEEILLGRLKRMNVGE
jgi:hypothetical protein